MRTQTFAALLLVLSLTIASRASDLVRLNVDKAHTRIDVAVHATMDSFMGTLPAYEAKVAVDPESGLIKRAEFHFKFADLRTGKADRDTKMLSWEENKRFPDGGFVMSELVPQNGGGFEARGTMTIHGVVRPISFPITITTDRKTYAVDGEAKIDTREYELPLIKVMMVLKVDPIVIVRFHLQASAN